MISEAKVDSFNFPKYYPTQHELKTLIERNGYFSIDRTEPLAQSTTHARDLNFQIFISHTRAAWEGVIKMHFGSDIIDGLFDRFMKKVLKFSPLISRHSSKQIAEIFVLLKRKAS